MRYIDRLKASARESALWRGHDLARFHPLDTRGDGRVTTYAECRRCPAAVWVLPRPDANECEIAGGAVSLNCPME